MEQFTNRKHAYLIIAHNKFQQLQTLISLLDDPRNDIYLHVDKKSRTFKPDTIQVKYSTLTLIDRISISWGGHSQIACELNLLKAALPKHYQYYHLISGIDLPLKTQDEIHDFFETNHPNNYIEFDESRSFLPRINKYYFFQNKIGRHSGTLTPLYRRLEWHSLQLQRKLKISRKQYIKAYKGVNWVSITDDLAQYIVNNISLIKKQFYYSFCGDEIFLHSIAMSSPYRKYIINNSLRAIDWERGNPYTYKKEDVDELLNSNHLFARKFDCDIDSYAIDKIVSHLSTPKS